MTEAPWDIVPGPTDYDNAGFIPEGDSYLAKWLDQAKTFRDQIGDNARLGQVYGSHPREAFDIFLTGTTPKGLFIFVHGGFWRMSGREMWSHLAQGAVTDGWAAALPSYPLCPEAQISDIARSIAKSIEVAARYIPGPIVLAGHSAGGQLVLQMAANAGAALPLAVAERLAAIVSISPLSDMAPLRHLPLNADWQITEAEITDQSPRRASAPDLPVEIVVGGAERQAFLDQADWMHAAWPKSNLTVVPDRHHFDVIDPLIDLSADWIKRPLAQA